MYLPITILAYFLNGIAVLVDKFMLVKRFPNPLTYVFYFSCFSLLVLLLLPFCQAPNLLVFLLASISTLLWTTGAYFMLASLQKSTPSLVIPMIGALTPTWLFLQALLNKAVSGEQIVAIVLLLVGLFLLVLPELQSQVDKLDLVKKQIPRIILSSILFAISYMVLRQAYLRENFLSVLVYSRVILVPLGLGLIIYPASRSIVFHLPKQEGERKFFSKGNLLFLLGQVSGGSSELLLTFAISLVTPALVNSLQGTQYAFLFLANLGLSKKYPHIFREDSQVSSISLKLLGIIFIAVGLYVLAFVKV